MTLALAGRFVAVAFATRNSCVSKVDAELVLKETLFQPSGTDAEHAWKEIDVSREPFHRLVPWSSVVRLEASIRACLRGISIS